MQDTNEEKIVAKVGMRVDVFTPKIRKYMGRGTITKVEDVSFMLGDEEYPVKDYPLEIRLDNGRKTEGCKCWWFPVSEDETK